MAKKPLEIHIDMDKKCKECGKGGATPSGYCMACVAAGIKDGKFDHIIKPIKDAVKSARRPTMAQKKVVVETTIKRRTRKKGSTSSLGTADFNLTESQEQMIDSWMDEGEAVRITIEQLNEKLPGC